MTVKKIKITNVQTIQQCSSSLQSIHPSQSMLRTYQLIHKPTDHAQVSHFNIKAEKENHKTDPRSVKTGKIQKTKANKYLHLVSACANKPNSQYNHNTIQRKPLHQLDPSALDNTSNNNFLEKQDVYSVRNVHLNHHGRPVWCFLPLINKKTGSSAIINQSACQSVVEKGPGSPKILHQTRNQYKFHMNQPVGKIIVSTDQKNEASVPLKKTRYLARRGRPVKRSTVSTSTPASVPGVEKNQDITLPPPVRIQENNITLGSTDTIEMHLDQRQQLSDHTLFNHITTPPTKNHEAHKIFQKNHEKELLPSSHDIDSTENSENNIVDHQEQSVDKGRYTVKHEETSAIFLNQLTKETIIATNMDTEEVSSSQRKDEHIHLQKAIRNKTNLYQSNIDMLITSHDENTQRNIHNDSNINNSNDDRNDVLSNMTWTSIHGDIDDDIDDNFFSNDNDTNSSEPEHADDVEIDTYKITDWNFIFDELHEKFDVHGNNDCEGVLKNLRIIKFLNWGLRSRITFQCKKCGHTDSLWTSSNTPNVGLPLNKAAVAGTLTTGIGYSALRELLSALNISCMSEVTYISHRDGITKIIESMSLEEMKKAQLEEIELAKAAGDVTPDGVPIITCIVDGAWSKRTYFNGRYDALSGVGIIIGARTGKVLFCGVRNKACSICERAERENRDAPDHVCYKNWDKNQPSSAMETDIIAEGFMASMNNKDPKYNLIYGKMIADGDSNVYNTIRTLDLYKDYGIVVEKIECKNHLYRNFCKHVKMASQHQLIHPPTQCTIGYLRERIHKSGLVMRKYVEKAVTKWNNTVCTVQQRVSGLREDINKMTLHTFGDHSKCTPGDEECEELREKCAENYIPVLRDNGILLLIDTAKNRLIQHADSLLKNLTNNPAELCNSVLCKEVGGKRINFCCRNSYYLRALCATVQFGTQEVLSKIMQSSGGQVPTVVAKLEQNRKDKNLRVREYRLENGRKKHFSGSGLGKNYGPLSQLFQAPDKEAALFEYEKERIRKLLVDDKNHRHEIEERTRGQSSCPEWTEKRRKLITASHFGPIYCQKPSTKCANRVKEIVKLHSRDSPGMAFGRSHEAHAIELLSEALGVTIDSSGLVIHDQHEMLACSPDGIIKNQNAIVEVKCLFKGKDLLPKDAIANIKTYSGMFEDRKNPIKLKKTHHYYHQVQGQLHVTKKSFCYFVIYTLKGIHYIKVEPDQALWDDMRPKLLAFWEDALLPELADSRIIRGMEVREPGSDSVWMSLKTKKNHQNSKRKNNKTQSVRNGKKKCRNNDYDSDSESSESEIDMQSDQEKEIHDSTLKTNKYQALGRIQCDQDDNASDISSIEIQEPVNQDHDDIIETIIGNIDEQATIQNNILRDREFLNDDAIQLFMDVLATHIEHIHPARVLHMSHQHLIRPCTTDRDLAVIGGQESRHWCCIHKLGNEINVYDSGEHRTHYGNFTNDEKTYLRRRYPSIPPSNIHFKRMRTQQPDGYSCGVYAAAFATTLAVFDDPDQFQYSLDVNEMRNHFVQVITEKELINFPLQR